MRGFLINKNLSSITGSERESEREELSAWPIPLRRLSLSLGENRSEAEHDPV
jgi:hypothetical protein